MRRFLLCVSAILFAIACQAISADANLEGSWRWWDQPGRGERYIARTPSLVFSDSYLMVYFDGRKNCAPFLALAFQPANTDERLQSMTAGQQIEVRIDTSEPILFRTAVAARSGDQIYFVHPIPASLVDAILSGHRMLARTTLAPQIDVFSLNGSGISIRHQQELCQMDPADGDPP